VVGDHFREVCLGISQGATALNIGLISQALPYLPSRGGFRLYGGNLMMRLCKRHRIDLVALLEPGDQEHLDWPRAYCASVTTLPAGGVSLPGRAVNLVSGYLWGRPTNHRAQFNALIQEALKTCRWDVMHIEGGFVGGIMSPEHDVAKVLSVHDSETLRAQEMLRCQLSFRDRLRYTLAQYYEPRYERQVYRRFERVIVVAERDLQFNRQLIPEANFALIPYGTDTEYFHPVPVAKEPKTLVFHSHFGYPPNIAAALEFANVIFPLVRQEEPDAVFHLVGAAPGPEVLALASRPGIRISADLPDLRPAVCSASVYVCAIRYGTGLKSKVLEALAMRMPIVGYHPGSTVGIDCVYGRHLLAAETPQEFAARVVDLLRNPERASDIAQAGRKLVEEKYSWESRARDYEALYEQVIAERQARTQGGRQGSRSGSEDLAP
jgi:polysaccharide biosynthesis protein PslH